MIILNGKTKKLEVKSAHSYLSLSILFLAIILSGSSLYSYFSLDGIANKNAKNNQMATVQLKNIQESLDIELEIQKVMEYQLNRISAFNKSFAFIASDPDITPDIDRLVVAINELKFNQRRLESIWPVSMSNYDLIEAGEGITILDALVDEAKEASQGELRYLAEDSADVLVNMQQSFQKITDQILSVIDLRREKNLKSIDQMIINSNQIQSEFVHLQYSVIIISLIAVLVAVFFQYLIGRRLERMRENALKLQIEAQAASQSKSEFLANMSHEIRTPMNSIIGFSSILINEALTASQQSYVQRIQNSSTSLLSIINDILDISKIEAGKIELSETNFDLIKLLESQLDLFAQKANENKIEFNVHIDNLVPLSFYGDAERLSQVLTNLLGNAFKFTSQGEVELSVTLASTSTLKASLQFNIRDTGIGIAKDKCETIFEAFTQADASTTRNFGGTGLGLAITQQFIELMGGRIWVDSKLGVGSCFQFIVPLHINNENDEGNVQLLAKQKLMTDSNLSLLLGYKNRSVNQSLLSQLKKYNLAVTSCSTFDAIKEKLKTSSVSLLLLDQELLKKNDRTEIDELRRDSKGKVNIILIAPLSMEKTNQWSQRLGIENILFKPIKPSELLATIERHTRKSQEAKPITALKETSPSAFNKLFFDCRVLIVDDVEANRELAHIMLTKFGCDVDQAKDGKQAIRAAQATCYSLILMDINMPHMDGLQATQLIRSHSLSQKTPIVALTAHTMSDDKERCLNAGMDAFLSKPFETLHLQQILLEYLPIANHCNKNETTLEIAPSAPKVTLLEETSDSSKTSENELSVADLNKGIQQWQGNKEMYLKLVNDFYKNSSQELATLTLAVEQNNDELVCNISHRMKGLAGSLIFPKLQDILQQLEDASAKKGQEVNPLRVEIPALQTKVEASLHELNHFIKNSPLMIEYLEQFEQEILAVVTNETPQKETLDIRLLYELAQKLKDSDMCACDHFDNLKAALQEYTFVHHLLNVLEQQLEVFEFNAALTSLEMIAKELDVDIKDNK